MARIEPVPVVLDAAETSARLCLDPRLAASAIFEDLLRQAQELSAPQALWDVAYIGAKGEGTVEVGGVTMASPVLRGQLDGINKVFPFIVTVGPALERAAGAQDDLLKQYYLEEMANLALEKAAARLAAAIEARFGLGPLSSLSPGSLADWPITEQPKLFSLLGDTERLVGVRLTESLLMLPRKSISGLFFPSEEGFSACQLCDRERCPGRKAPFSAPPSRSIKESL
ncbi:MAG: vitamin B12 dependent methionine synthase [Acidobacteria bacterium]|nr:vitamin B12 dependent methionine synthase [Acidobacteriota bacterium]